MYKAAPLEPRRETEMSMERQNIAALLHRIAGARLLVVGDFMLDRTIYGEAGRISPEAPTPVVLVQHTREELGGAGNVVRNVGSLGGEVWCTAVAGEDEAGERLERQLRAAPGCRAVLMIAPAKENPGWSSAGIAPTKVTPGTCMSSLTC